MINLWIALVRCRRGTTATEFAFIVGPLLMLMFAVASYGQYFWADEGLQEAAIAGARCVGALSVSCATGTPPAYSSTLTTAFIQAEAKKWSLTLPAAGISVNTSTSCGGVSGFALVTLTYTYNGLMLQLLNLTSTSQTLNAYSCFPTNSAN